MRFQLPQFIETETKIVGPFTIKQFIWIAAGAAICYVFYLLLGLSIWFFMVALIFGGAAAALAFYRPDGIPLINYIMYAVNFNIGAKRFLFRKNNDNIDIPHT